MNNRPNCISRQTFKKHPLKSPQECVCVCASLTFTWLHSRNIILEDNSDCVLLGSLQLYLSDALKTWSWPPGALVIQQPSMLCISLRVDELLGGGPSSPSGLLVPHKPQQLWVNVKRPLPVLLWAGPVNAGRELKHCLCCSSVSLFCGVVTFLFYLFKWN